LAKAFWLTFTFVAVSPAAKAPCAEAKSALPINECFTKEWKKG
jgi:hypothetical protein